MNGVPPQASKRYGRALQEALRTCTCARCQQRGSVRSRRARRRRERQALREMADEEVLAFEDAKWEGLSSI